MGNLEVLHHNFTMPPPVGDRGHSPLIIITLGNTHSLNTVDIAEREKKFRSCGFLPRRSHLIFLSPSI